LRVVAHAFGVPEKVLACERVETPIAGSGAVRLRMLLSPVNPSDLIPVTGAYRHRTPLPFVPGFEGVAVIEEVGPGVDAALLGRRVIPVGSEGNWQSRRSHAADWCLPVPDDITDVQASMAYINPLTALLMVRALEIRPGDTVGITAAGSAIGRILARMIAAAGGRPLPIVRSQAALDAFHREQIEAVGSHRPLPRLAAGLDAVGGATGEQLAAAIRPGGTLLHYGLLSGEPLRNAGGAALQLFRLRDWVHAVPRPQLHAAMDTCFTAIRLGQVDCTVSARYPLTRFAQALEHDRRPGRRGKVLLDLDS